MKNEEIKFLVASDLRDKFVKVVDINRKSVDQVLSDLMLDYVGKFYRPTPISNEERQRREYAVNFAKASVGLEGFERSEEAEAHAQRFIHGEIDLEEYLAKSYRDIHGK